MSDHNESISLMDLFSVLLRRKWIVITFTTIGILFSVIYSVISLKLSPEKSYYPNVYTPKALMLINDPSSSSSSLSSLLSSGNLGSLASFAGVSANSGTSYKALAVYLVTTNSFLDSVVDKFGIIERYHIKKNIRSASRAILKQKIIAEIDETSGVFSISYTDIDPVFAQSVVNYCVLYMEQRFTDLGIDKNKIQKENLEKNLKSTYDEIISLEQSARNFDHFLAQESASIHSGSVIMESTKLNLELAAQKSVYSQLKTQYEVLKISMKSESPVFQILEYAEVPDQKSGPNRARLCLIVTLVAFFASIFLVFLLNTIEKIKNDSYRVRK